MARNLIRFAAAAIVVVLALCVSTQAFAQATYVTSSGQRVNGVVPLNCNASATSCVPRAQADTAGDYVISIPSNSSSVGLNPAVSAAASSSLVAKGFSGNLYGFNVTAGASAGYVLVYNASATPGDGAVTPIRCIPLAANAGIEVNLRGQPMYLSAGIVIAFSTTGCFTQTLSATAFIAADVK